MRSSFLTGAPDCRSVVLLLLLSLTLCSGCRSGPSPSEQQAQVTREAESELACAKVDTTVVSAHACGYAGKYYTCSDTYRIVGCAQIAEYTCVEDNTDGCFELFHTTVASSASDPLTLDGAPFEPTGDQACVASAGAPGVTFTHADGDAIQIIQNFDHSLEVIVHRANGAVSPPMQDCASAVFTRPSHGGVGGTVSLHCSSAGLRVQGSATFSECS